MELESSYGAPPQRSWWGRNWKWVVPVGCGVPILICGGFLAIIFFVVSQAITSSQPYIDAIAAVQSDANAQTALGSPIEVGTLTQGSIDISDSSGTANFAIPVSGPNGSGVVHVDAVRSGGVWTYNTLTLVVDDTGERIDLQPPVD